MTKAIIFDLGGVLFTNGTEITIAKIVGEYKVSEKIVRDALGDNGKLGQRYRSGKITPKQFWYKALKSWALNVEWERLNKTWLDSYKLKTDTFRICRRLKKNKQIKLGIISNTIRDRLQYLENKYHFLQYFEAQIFSFDVGVTKPNPAIFKLALKFLKVTDPSTVIYIDDKEKHVKAAEKAGLNGVLFKNASALEKKLKEMALL